MFQTHTEARSYFRQYGTSSPGWSNTYHLAKPGGGFSKKYGGKKSGQDDQILGGPHKGGHAGRGR